MNTSTRSISALKPSIYNTVNRNSNNECKFIAKMSINLNLQMFAFFNIFNEKNVHLYILRKRIRCYKLKQSTSGLFGLRTNAYLLIFESFFPFPIVVERVSMISVFHHLSPQ